MSRPALFVADGVEANAVFRLDHPSNRDNCNYPFLLMQQKFQAQGIELATPDQAGPGEPAFTVYLDHPGKPAFGANEYLILIETPHIRRKNADLPAIRTARTVFSWQDDYVRDFGFVKINFPNNLQVPAIDGWQHRDRFCCLIAGNKSVAMNDGRELYTERVRAIRWYEQHAPADFDLYGVDWDLPPPRPGMAGKVAKRLWRYLAPALRLRPFPSYRGKVERKRDVLLRTRFSICYENVRDVPGYITEKIFDCFFAGCVPVYWGADNIGTHIPADCYIDRRRFADTAAVHAHLKAMTEDEFKGYQRRIADFLASDQAYPFSSACFAETVVNTIVRDLGRLP